MSNRKKGWGFPKWGNYGQDRDTINVRMCDFADCGDKADHPAPKAPNSPEKWWFCQEHAGEYNKNWDFFQGMTKAEAKEYAHDEKRTAKGFGQSTAYSWGGATGDDGLTRIERDAFNVLELDGTESFKEIKTRYRSLAKQYHPDRNLGNKEAEQKFQRVNTAYDALKSREEKKSYTPK